MDIHGGPRIDLIDTLGVIISVRTEVFCRKRRLLVSVRRIHETHTGLRRGLVSTALLAALARELAWTGMSISARVNVSFNRRNIQANVSLSAATAGETLHVDSQWRRPPYFAACLPEATELHGRHRVALTVVVQTLAMLVRSAGR